ncbi:lysophospholipid acyltransferase LPEAT2-like isoform X3 [Cynara cardunculus var. scolymus]|uniref:lysophospholipid acyltransferase LPEAT2-like isoform X3 n=1 Tax=Cynara cardunculus var. scolymus TaxID=59895 RepID=UPI000D62CC37|nr:lysophospholipid acyltransferase LPEAT2-like isoform X3 [Cynara cardunculus var. scolymus]
MAAAAKDLKTPLLLASDDRRRLSQPPSDADHQLHVPQLILNVNEQLGPPPSSNQEASTNQYSISIDTQLDFDENPYGFIGSNGFEVPGSTTVDPFRNHTPTIEGVYEWLKVLVCVPIALVRLVLFGLCLSIGYFATKFALHGWKDKHNPMPRWRCRVMWITRLCTRGILFAFGYHWIKRKGKPAPREIAPILVSNHVSYIDPIFFFYELFPTIVASESHDSMPFVGTIIRAMQVIYVNRFSHQSRKNAVNEIKPVVVRYPHVHFDQSWGHIALATLMFRMFTQFHNFMEVEYLPVVSPSEHHKESAARFAEKTGRAMARSLNVVQTSHSYVDYMLLSKAADSGQENPSHFMVEMANIQQSFHLSSSEALDFLDRFLSMNPDPSGKVKIQDFLRAFRLKACGLSEKIFEFIDVDKNRKITFKEFLVGSVHILKQPLFRQACEAAFTETDMDQDHYISEQELGASLLPAIGSLSTDEIRSLFNLFDGDGDGRISKGDFIICLRRNPLLIGLFSPHFMHKDLDLNAAAGFLEETV